MTDLGINFEPSGGSQPPSGGGGRRRAATPKKRGPWLKILITLVVVAVIAVGGYWGVNKAQDAFAGTPDYTGQGSGAITVEIKDGDTTAAIGRTLKSEGVVKSVDAFIAAVAANADAGSLQPGFYKLRKQMSAEWAVRELVDKDNRIESKVLIREGARVGQIVTAIAKGTEITEKQVIAALKKPETLGLPDEAEGNPEGYLFPATYTVEPGTTATQLLQEMVKKTVAVEEKLDIAARAAELGITKYQALIVASIVEYEASRDEDLAKVARVIYNRLDAGMALQMDSTVTYVSQREGDVWTTPDERSVDSAYNTYKNVGLPPTPIGSPGEKTIEAALQPDEGNWLYFVPINLDTGETVFTNSYSEHLRNKDKLVEFCKSSPKC
ncbi:endolytic transglycosylase MltG [soil metagenome]